MKRPLGYFRILSEYSQNTFFERSWNIPREHFWDTLGIFHGNTSGILQEYSTGTLLEYFKNIPCMPACMPKKIMHNSKLVERYTIISKALQNRYSNIGRCWPHLCPAFLLPRVIGGPLFGSFPVGTNYSRNILGIFRQSIPEVFPWNIPGIGQ